MPLTEFRKSFQRLARHVNGCIVLLEQVVAGSVDANHWQDPFFKEMHKVDGSCSTCRERNNEEEWARKQGAPNLQRDAAFLSAIADQLCTFWRPGAPRVGAFGIEALLIRPNDVGEIVAILYPFSGKLEPSLLVLCAKHNGFLGTFQAEVHTSKLPLDSPNANSVQIALAADFWGRNSDCIIFAAERLMSICSRFMIVGFLGPGFFFAVLCMPKI